MMYLQKVDNATVQEIPIGFRSLVRALSQGFTEVPHASTEGKIFVNKELSQCFSDKLKRYLYNI